MSHYLRSFPGFETNDPEVNQENLRANFAVSHFDCGHRISHFIAKANWAETKYVRITNAFCNTSTNITYGATPHVKQFIHTGDKASFALEINGRQQELTPSSAAVIIPADTRYRCIASASHEVIALRIEETALNNIASAMLGDELKGELELRSPLPKADVAFKQMQNAVLHLIADLDTGIPGDSFAAEALGQALLVRFLLSSSHKFSNRLMKDVCSPSGTQLRQIEEFIAANWHRELDIEEIAKTFGIGVRSVFRYFKTIRGMTPQEFIRQIKLNRAHRMLEDAEDGDSVMAIGLRCGFQSMGHFAREYRRAFGELPSDTLRRSRLAQRVVLPINLHRSTRDKHGGRSHLRPNQQGPTE